MKSDFGRPKGSAERHYRIALTHPCSTPTMIRDRRATEKSNQPSSCLSMELWLDTGEEKTNYNNEHLRSLLNILVRKRLIHLKFTSKIGPKTNTLEVGLLETFLQEH